VVVLLLPVVAVVVTTLLAKMSAVIATATLIGIAVGIATALAALTLGTLRSTCTHSETLLTKCRDRDRDMKDDRDDRDRRENGANGDDRKGTCGSEFEVFTTR
jgi:hypothetical protein